MKLHHLEARVGLAHPLDEVFAFFADAGNLEFLTPPWLHFRILTPPPIVMTAGTTISYRLRLHGIPIPWRSEITAWDPPYRFVDEQRHGPYKQWIHEHTFTDHPRGTLVRDNVTYAVPGGALVNRLLVIRDLQRIFAYRRARIIERLGPEVPSVAVEDRQTRGLPRNER